MSAVAAVMLGVLVAWAPATVKRWAEQEPVVGDFVEADAQGVHLRLQSDTIATLIPWYDVERVELENGTLARYDRFARQAWRAHARAQRGDYQGALPLYESMRDEYLWKPGPQSMDVSIGLKRCLINQGDRAQAIEPALAWFVSSRMLASVDASGVSSVDAQTMLHTDLPPIRSSSAPTAPLDLDVHAGITERERLLYACFRLVDAPAESRESIVAEIETHRRSMPARDAGVVLFEQMAYAQAHPDRSKRNAARDALRRRCQTQHDTWIEVWARLAIGAALLNEPDRLRKDLGVVELLHVIVRLHAIDPNLTMFAAELAAGHLESTGRAQWATQILHDTQRHIASPLASQEYQSND